MVAQGATLGAGGLRGEAGSLDVAEELLHVVLEAVAHLDGGGAAHAHDAALVAARAHHAGFLVAGDADAGDARGDHGGHEVGDAVAVGVGLHDRADLRLAVEQRLQGADVVLEGGLVDLDPGVGGLVGGAGGVQPGDGQRRRGLGGEGETRDERRGQGGEGGVVQKGLLERLDCARRAGYGRTGVAATGAGFDVV